MEPKEATWKWVRKHLPGKAIDKAWSAASSAKDHAQTVKSMGGIKDSDLDLIEHDAMIRDMNRQGLVADNPPAQELIARLFLAAGEN